VLREPVGVVGQIVPWNFPLAMACGKLGRRSAGGGARWCSSRPSRRRCRRSSLRSWRSRQGFPEGVINVITGYGRTAGAALASHMDVDKVAFTGSTVTGRAIIEASKSNFKRVSLELGGKSPTFIFRRRRPQEGDSRRRRWGSSSTPGRSAPRARGCSCRRKVADQVLEGIAGMAKMLRVGQTLDPETMIGPFG
jgi:phenylacetaldehyde dehydrogenase